MTNELRNSENPLASGAKLGIGARGKRINLVKLAEAQRSLLWCILARVGLEIAFLGSPGFGGGFGGGGAGNIGLFVYLGGLLLLTGFTLVFTVRVGVAYGVHPAIAVLAGLATIVSCLGLFVLLALNLHVSSTLTKAGCRVGLLGVSAAEMNKLRLGVCWQCGYSLSGLVAPVCPECGAALDPAR